MAAESARFCLALEVEIKADVLIYKTSVGDVPVSIHFLKAPDVARLLRKNLLDLGVTGDEWLMENGIAPDLRCFEARSYSASISLLMAEGDLRPLHLVRSVFTPFPNLARDLLQTESPGAEIMAVSGSSESLVPDIGDACFDVVETGTTASQNSLVIRKVYEQVTTHLVRSEKCDLAAGTPVIELLADAFAR